MLSSSFRNAEEPMTFRRGRPAVHSNRLRETTGAQQTRRAYKVEDDETIEHFLESLRQRGLFAGLEVGCDEYERRTSMALRKFEERFGSRLRAAEASAHAAARSMDTVGQTQPRGAEADEAVSSSNQEPHSSSEGAGASADATRRDAELLAPSTPCENAPPPSAETDTVDSRPADETEHHAARDRCAASDDDDAESTDDEAADLTAPERSRLMETATQQLLAHNYQGAVLSFNRAMALNPEGQELANMLIMRASCYLHLQRFEEALEDGKQATKLDVTTAIAARAFIRIGMAYEGLGRFTDAIRFGYDIAELLDVRNAHLLRNKAAAEAHRNAGASEDSD